MTALEPITSKYQSPFYRPDVTREGSLHSDPKEINRLAVDKKRPALVLLRLLVVTNKRIVSRNLLPAINFFTSTRNRSSVCSGGSCTSNFNPLQSVSRKCVKTETTSLSYLVSFHLWNKVSSIYIYIYTLASWFSCVFPNPRFWGRTAGYQGNGCSPTFYLKQYLRGPQKSRPLESSVTSSSLSKTSTLLTAGRREGKFFCSSRGRMYGRAVV